MKLINRMRRRGYGSVDVRRAVLDRYNERIQEDLQGSVWLGGCGTYFLDEHGKVRTQLPYRFYRYWLMSARLRSGEFVWGRRDVGTAGGQ
jgi:cyclohexanone monooxygenase